MDGYEPKLVSLFDHTTPIEVLMSPRDLIISTLEAVRRTVYNGPVRSFCRRTRIESALRRAYSGVLSRVSGEDIITKEVGGREVEFYQTTGMEVQRLQSFLEERAVLERLLGEIRTDDVIYDVGANVGVYTCPIAADATSGHVVAFEPHPANRSRLEENVALNDLTDRVTVSGVALSDEGGMAELAIHGTDEPGEGTHSLSTNGSERTIDVQTATGDELVSKDDFFAPDVLKIDVEGAEASVLRGFKRLLDHGRCRIVYCELHPEAMRDLGDAPGDVRTLLEDTGYEVEIFKRRGGEHFLRAERRADS